MYIDTQSFGACTDIVQGIDQNVMGDNSGTPAGQFDSAAFKNVNLPSLRTQSGGGK